jgi:hypothetical protein
MISLKALSIHGDLVKQKKGIRKLFRAVMRQEDSDSAFTITPGA